MRRIICTILFACLSSGEALSQATPTPAPAPGLPELKHLIEVSQRRGELESVDAKPFHLKATIMLTSLNKTDKEDVTGKTDQPEQTIVPGTIDVLWQDARHHREEITLGDQRWLTVDDGTQVWRIGDKWIWPAALLLGRKVLLRPFLEFPETSNRLTYVRRQNGAVELECVATEPELPNVAPDLPLAQTTFCLAPGSHLLRLIDRPNNYQISFNEITNFGDKHIPRMIEVSRGETIVARIRVDSLTTPDDLTALAEPSPEGAQMIPYRDEKLPTGEIFRGQLLTASGPPARSAMLQGKAVLKVHINTLGEVESEEVVSSNNDFVRNAALAAVKRWRFRVAYRNGVLVSADETVQMKF